MEQQTELRKIDDALKALEGALTGEALAAAQKPLLEKRRALLGSAAYVKGDQNLVVGPGAVHVGGNVGGSIVTGTQVNTGGGAYVGDGVNTDGGDFVGRDKTTRSDGGGIAVSGSLRDSTLRVGTSGAPRQTAEPRIRAAIEQLGNLSSEDRRDLTDSIEQVFAEAQKGAAASQPVIERHLRDVKRIAPSIHEMLRAALTQGV